MSFNGVVLYGEVSVLIVVSEVTFRLLFPFSLGFSAMVAVRRPVTVVKHFQVLAALDCAGFESHSSSIWCEFTFRS